MMHIRRMMALLMCLFLLPVTALAQSQRLPLQDAHKATYKKNSDYNTNYSTLSFFVFLSKICRSYCVIGV